MKRANQQKELSEAKAKDAEMQKLLKEEEARRLELEQKLIAQEKEQLQKEVFSVPVSYIAIFRKNGCPAIIK